VDEDGTCQPFVKPSTLGGMGLFTKGKPMPIEYKRDGSLRNAGFLTIEENDELWQSQSKLASQYLMEVCIDTQWYRDEVTGDGALRPITEMSQYAEFGQDMDWDEEEMAMVLVRGQKNIFIPILPTDETSAESYSDNVSVAANDRCFGIDPSETPDLYDDTDAEKNALEMIPCLRKGEDGKLWWSSVWLYPRVDWKWDDDREEEITFMYGWDLLPWMKQVQPPFASVDNRDERAAGMQVPYEIKPDQYGGKGLFAKEDVKAGTMVWSKPKSNCTIKTEAEMKEYCETATHEELLLILNFCYCEDDGLFTFVDITQDDGGYFNHTNGKPNIALGVEYQRHQVKDCDLDPGSSYALYDIPAGTEFVDNYNTYGECPDWYNALLDKHGIDESYMKA